MKKTITLTIKLGHSYFADKTSITSRIIIDDYKSCKCGAVAVDGGKDYLRRRGSREYWEELSKYCNISIVEQKL